MTLFDALDLAWLDGAACARVREPLWFSDREADKRAAVRICGGCPVRVECWQASERRNERIGIWPAWSGAGHGTSSGARAAAARSRAVTPLTGGIRAPRASTWSVGTGPTGRSASCAGRGSRAR